MPRPVADILALRPKLLGAPAAKQSRLSQAKVTVAPVAIHITLRRPSVAALLSASVRPPVPWTGARPSPAADVRLRQARQPKTLLERDSRLTALPPTSRRVPRLSSLRPNKTLLRL